VTAIVHVALSIHERLKGAGGHAYVSGRSVRVRHGDGRTSSFTREAAEVFLATLKAEEKRGNDGQEQAQAATRAADVSERGA